MLAAAMRPAIDNAAGPVRGAVRVAVGPRQFDNIRDAMALEAVDRTIKPFKDPEFSRAAGRQDQRSDRAAHQGAPAAGLRGDDALGDQGGRVDAVRPRSRHGVRRWPAPPRAVRGRGAEVSDPHGARPTRGAARASRRCARPPRPCPGVARIAATAAARLDRSGRSGPACARAGCWSGRSPTPRPPTSSSRASRTTSPRRHAPSATSRAAVSAGVPVTKALRDATVSFAEVVLADVTAHERRARARAVAARARRGAAERSRDVWGDGGGAPGVRPDPRRAGPRRGAHPAAAPAGRPAALGRRPHRRPGRHGEQRRWWLPGCR